ncbi:hypothetical protein [Actinomadura xylanilytica]|uniref:hypothetical protein n=1 Tax=Actinomadura xylanilytica TaxID=887459 RepID=UPI00255AF647|nr:hypothetical protein [Actinomadura xylanilytica]MDL4777858.1 hypothetical protein [Actinomadura xylanilytica]
MTDTAGDRVMVELVGGPWDGHRQDLMSAADLDGPRERLGTWVIVDGPWPDDVPDGCVARAVYEPGPEPAPANIWRYQGWIYT